MVIPMRKYEICGNGTAYVVNVDEAECIITSETPRKLRHLRKRHKSYVKWLRRIKSIK